MMILTNFLVLLATVESVYCWGDLGHRTVAYLAQKYLTDDASQLVNTLLSNDQGYDISDGAIWADSVKRRPGYTQTAEWHYIDAQDDPPRTCGVRYKRDCKAGPGCVVSAITNMTSRINDGDLDIKQQNEALMFLLHFIGDIHQPLHTEMLDRGGNEIKVCFDSHCGEKINLHGIWDKEILHKHRGLKHTEGDHTILKEAAAQWAEELHSSNAAKGMIARAECSSIDTAQKCALEWATESNSWICKYVLQPSVDWIEQNDLGGDYFNGAVTVVDDLIGKAGLRLGAWLNALAAARSAGAGFIVQNNERVEV